MIWCYRVVFMEDGKVMSNLNVLYEDNHIIVVEKPVNVLSQGDITNDLSLCDMVKDYIKEKYNKPGNVYVGLVHRLDRPVGGIMVFAKTSKAASRLCKQISERNFSKKYYAIVSGRLEKDNDKFVDKIKKLDNGNSIVANDGKYAELSYEVISYNRNIDASLVDITLETGRHHQIRVQFASRNHALLGDQRYGKKDKTQIALFSYKLEFYHPVTKDMMTFDLKPRNIGYWSYFTL